MGMKTKTSQTNPLVSGPLALARRDALEAAITLRLPVWFQLWVSVMLTWLTGLAPSASGGQPARPGGEARAFWLMMAALVLGGAAVLTGNRVLLGGLALVYGMRSFSSVVGHHMTHLAKVLPGPAWISRLVYDVASALLLLPRFAVYQLSHRRHHAYTAGPDDPDQRFIAHLGARFDGPLRFFLTVIEPRFHLLFLRARLGAALLDGPLWRRAIPVGFHAAMAMWASPQAILTWAFFAGLLYQVASLTQWSSEHLWGKRPASGKAVEIATAVTYGRLLLPDPASRGLWLRLPLYALARLLLVTGDLINHDLHHVGRGPWADHAYIRTRLILEGRIALRQTVTLRGMFEAAFASALSGGGGPAQPPRAMGGQRMLEM